MKSTKRSLFASVLALVLCVCMLLGTTWAWFTDEVQSGVNQIVAGNLDVELYAGDTKVDSNTKLFQVDLWEPGMVVYENFTVKNVGNLALKYALNLNIADKNSLTTNGVAHNLSEVIKVAVSEVPFSGNRADAQALKFQTLADFQKTGSLVPAAGDTYGVVLYWEPTDSDNLYNVNNGQSVNTSTKGVSKEAANNALFIDFGIKLTATQLTYEYDSFDNMYDNIDSTNIPAFWSGESEKAKITPEQENKYEVVESGQIKASVTIPATATVTYEDGSEVKADDEFALVVEPGTNNSNGVIIGTANSITTFDVSLENVLTHEKVVSNEAMKVTLDVGFIDMIRFYHKGTQYTNKVNSADAVVEVGQFYYDLESGIVTFMSKDFSPFSAVYKFAGGVGSEAHPYLIAKAEHFKAMRQMGGYFKQIESFVIGGSDTVYYPGYGGKFVYDGNNHSITLDENYSNKYGDIMLFHTPLNDVTIKNLDFYSNDNVLLYLIYGIGSQGKVPQGDWTLNLLVDNCDAYSLNGKTIQVEDTNATVYFQNFGTLNKDKQGKYAPGVTELKFRNCDNYVSFQNNSYNASMLLGLGLYWDDYKTLEVTNCNNYGLIEAKSGAGLITGHLYESYYRDNLKWTAEQVRDAITFSNSHNYGTIKAKLSAGAIACAAKSSMDKNGVDIFTYVNSQLCDVGENYVLSEDLAGTYNVGVGTNGFELTTDATSDYSYKLAICFDTIHQGNVINNSTALLVDLNKVDSLTKGLTASSIHGYDINTAIEKGIVSNKNLNFNLECRGTHCAIVEKDGTIYIIFNDEYPEVYKLKIDTSVSLSIVAYNSDGISVGNKSLQ